MVNREMQFFSSFFIHWNKMFAPPVVHVSFITKLLSQIFPKEKISRDVMKGNF